MLNKKNLILTFIIILIVVLVEGASVLAERTVPGDMLYGLKISVNEKIAGIFALSTEEKTEWRERLVERRLEEMQKLVSRNNLNETTRISLENQIKIQIYEFNTSVSELALQKNESAKSSDLNIRLQASLSAYQNVLQNLSEKTDIDANTKQEIQKLILVLNEYQNKIGNDQKNLELNVGVDQQNSATSTNSAKMLEKQNAALNLLNSTKLSYQKEKVNLSINIQNQINDKLALAEVSLQEGKTFMTSGDYINAINKFKMVISEVNVVKLLMLSNVIKRDIEEDMGPNRNNDDIENGDEFEGD